MSKTSDDELREQISNLSVEDAEGTAFTLEDVDNGGWLNAIMELVKADRKATIAQRERQAERRGERAALQLLYDWMKLFGINAFPSDIKHRLDSLDQFPDQPLASESLAALATSKGKAE